jgi:hypothetical protein
MYRGLLYCPHDFVNNYSDGVGATSHALRKDFDNFVEEFSTK